MKTNVPLRYFISGTARASLHDFRIDGRRLVGFLFVLCVQGLGLSQQPKANCQLPFANCSQLPIAIDFSVNLTNNVRVQMHTNRFSYGFTYRYFFGSSGVADGV